MKDLYPNGEFIASFEAVFEGVRLSYEEVFIERAKAHCFFAGFSDESLLKSSWAKISNYLAVKYQSKLETEFERWNVYLFILTDQQIDDALKYHIENDTFSSRKIIISPKQAVTEIIKEHILNNDLNVLRAEQTEIKLDPNPLIWGTLKDVTSMKRITQDIKDSLDYIIEGIKRRPHEI